MKCLNQMDPTSHFREFQRVRTVTLCHVGEHYSSAPGRNHARAGLLLAVAAVQTRRTARRRSSMAKQIWGIHSENRRELDIP